MNDDDTGSIERAPWLPYRAGYRIARDLLDDGADRARIGRRLPTDVAEYARRRGWDSDPELMELIRQGAEDAAEGRRPSIEGGGIDDGIVRR